MQKVYLLLRSNKQTGPYTLEELLQFNLKPFDLIWVEGRSAAWQYPFEIPALTPYVTETPQASFPFEPVSTSAMEEKLPVEQTPVSPKTEIPKRVFVSVPKTYSAANDQAFDMKQSVSGHEQAPVQQTPYEQKETPKLDIPSYSRASASYTREKVAEKEAVHTNYSKSLNEVEEDYTNWIYRQKTKKKTSINAKELVLAGIILIIIGGGYYVMSRPSVANSVLPANKIARQEVQPLDTRLETKQAEESVSQEDQKTLETANHEQKQPENLKTKNPVSVSKHQTNSSVPPVQNSMPDEKTSNIPDENNQVLSQEPEVKKQSTVQNSPEKKKKLGEVIKGIFSKKEKKEDTNTDKEVVLEEPKPANNRQATRREDGETAKENNEQADVASLADQVELSSNTSDNWMMGIKNLKITLRNRSNTTIQTASVTVHYYDENNKLLEKKLVYFNNVAPKAKATVAAPDNKWADHIDFKLTTVSAKEDRYATSH